jgi:diadenosine tetraphosphate (Ap4A) HIT family hydrolase
VVLRWHATELYELSTVERARMIEDVSRMAQAVAMVYQPVKMNYELLGNQVAHIHWHLIPRLARDPEPRWPVWRLQHDPTPLPMEEVAERIESLRRALAAYR